MSRFDVFPEEPKVSVGEVAKALRVSPKTVSRWCDAGKIAYARTLGGHRRIPIRELERLLARR